jgi:hypothetical protein
MLGINKLLRLLAAHGTLVPKWLWLGEVADTTSSFLELAFSAFSKLAMTVQLEFQDTG